MKVTPLGTGNLTILLAESVGCQCGQCLKQMAWHQYQALSSTGMDFISSLWLGTGDSTVVEHSP
jgi:hypothetical protein